MHRQPTYQRLLLLAAIVSACVRFGFPDRRRRRARGGRRREQLARLRPHLRRAALQPARPGERRHREALGLDWHLELPGDGTLNATPLVVDGVMFFTGSYSKSRAVDAKTGKLLWEYDPKATAHAGERLRVMWDSSRGIAYWKGKVVIATIDGRLIALDAKTGKRLLERRRPTPTKALTSPARRGCSATR